MAEKVIVYDPPEHSRIYNFPMGERICLYDVVKVTISESGTHYVERLDGYTHEVVKMIVNTGWMTLEVSGDQNWPGETECECGCNCNCDSDLSSYTPEFSHWTDDDKVKLALAADEIISVAFDLRNNPALQKFFGWKRMASPNSFTHRNV